MGLQLKKYVFVWTVLFAFCSCSRTNLIKGNWGAFDSSGKYSELYFSQREIRIYNELAGSISSQSYIIKEDSLFTNILRYKMEKISSDSLILMSDSFSIYLSKIKTGFKLSDLVNEKDKDTYLTNFYERRNKLIVNRAQNDNDNDSIKTINEEIISIEK